MGEQAPPQFILLGRIAKNAAAVNFDGEIENKFSPRIRTLAILRGVCYTKSDQSKEAVMTLAEEKKALRTFIRKKERTLDPAYKAESSAAICRHLIEHPAYRAANVVMAFVGTEHEIDTTALLLDALARGKTLCVPRCREGHQMDLCVIVSLDDLEPGAYGILEPKKHCPTVTAGQIDFAVIPCLSFDRTGGRLGQGGGYYDRFLSALRCESVLICREALTVAHVPCEAHDLRCTLLATENGVFAPEP